MPSPSKKLESAVQQQPDEARDIRDEHGRLGAYSCTRPLESHLGEFVAGRQGGRLGGVRSAARAGALEERDAGGDRSSRRCRPRSLYLGRGHRHGDFLFGGLVNPPARRWSIR